MDRKVRVKGMVFVALGAMCATNPTSQAFAADIEAEISEWVVKPCYVVNAAFIVLSKPEETMAGYATLDAVTRGTSDGQQKLAGSLATSARGKDWKERKEVYNAALLQCMKTAIDQMKDAD